MDPIIIGIGGGTGSGKTTVAKEVRKHFPEESVVIMHHDSYYLDRSDEPLEERRHVESLDAANLHDMQRHDETDEVFVLLRGRCILFVGDGNDEAGTIHAVDQEPLKVYNVKRGVWHNHTLSEDASVLVVENRDTTVDNSPFTDLTADQKEFIVAETRRLWGNAD